MILKNAGQGLDWQYCTGLEVQEDNSCSFFCSSKCKQIWLLSGIRISWWPIGWAIWHLAFTLPSPRITYGKGCQLLPSRWHEDLIISWSVFSLGGSSEEDCLRAETMTQHDMQFCLWRLLLLDLQTLVHLGYNMLFYQCLFPQIWYEEGSSNSQCWTKLQS